MVQLSHPYMTTGKTIALTRCLDLCQQSNVTAFLPRSRCLLISWLQSLSTVIMEPKKIKSVTVSIVSPSICHEVLGRVLYKWKSAIDWRFVFPQNSPAEILPSKVMVFADWAFGMY